MSERRSKTFLADWLRRHMPTREQMARNKYLRPIAHRFLTPELWRFTRRSVPRGVAPSPSRFVPVMPAFPKAHA